MICASKLDDDSMTNPTEFRYDAAVKQTLEQLSNTRDGILGILRCQGTPIHTSQLSHGWLLACSLTLLILCR